MPLSIDSLSFFLGPIGGVTIRSVGWRCHGASSMNPRLVTLHVSADGVKFKLWDKFQTPKERGGGDQIYCCTSINSSIYPYLVLEVNENFGGEQTSIDRVFLYSDEIISSPEYLTNGEKCDNFGTNGGNKHIVS